MIVDAVGAEKMADLPAADEEGVGDEPAMAFVRQSLGTHDSGGRFLGDVAQLVKRCTKFRGLHVIGVGVEGLDAPGGVRRIGKSIGSPAAEVGEMAIGDAGFGQPLDHCVMIEMRVAARAGEATDIGDSLDVTSSQNFESFIRGARGMAKRVHHSRRFLLECVRLHAVF